MENLYELLPLSVAVNLPKKISELRMRIGKPLAVFDGTHRYFVKNGDENYVVSRADIDYVLGVASGYSLYTVSDSLKMGYLTWRGGIRIGVSGEGVTEGGRLIAMKNISSLCIRVPVEIKGVNASLINKIVKDKALNTLVISPTAGGKTTFLRELARRASECGLWVAVIDERGELAACHKGMPTLDVGQNSDIITGVNKLSSYEMLIRSMNPDLIVTDEVYGEAEISAVSDAVRAGVKVAASVHANSVQALADTPYDGFLRLFEVIVVLSKIPKVGTVAEVRGV